MLFCPPSLVRGSFTEILHALSFCAISRHLVGEQLEKLTLKELQQLEQQLETALRKIRSRKNNMFFDSIHDLQRKATNSPDLTIAELPKPQAQWWRKPSSLLPKRTAASCHHGCFACEEDREAVVVT
ncbi:hypothetical protein BHM03_00011523 [Ensete ventricosum]|nr:hypothetical protein BHM03_00011523 [Ensete ventricosum]